MTTTTLCYIENDDKFLMLHRVKKQDDMNEGKWIGVGGHVESQETPEECLVREVKEETGLTLTSYKFRGLVTFINSECESELMCVFTADEYTGELIECDEGELCWVDKAMVPNLPAWEGDQVFLDLICNIDYMGDGKPCHFMDIYRPRNYEGKLPVMFNLHGGGFLLGKKKRAICSVQK